LLGSGLLGGVLSSWNDTFFALVSSKAFSVYGEEVDDQIITETDMPHWMDTDTLYLFKFESDKDESEHIKKMQGKQLLVIEPVHDTTFKSRYNFNLETKEAFHFCGLDYCKDMNRWVSALRKIKQNSEEKARTKLNLLVRNIDPLVVLYKKKVNPLHQKNEAILELAFREPNAILARVDLAASPIKEFVKALSEAQTCFLQTLDALQATRPFYQDLFKLLLSAFHKRWTEFARNYWNARLKEFDVGLLDTGSLDPGVPDASLQRGKVYERVRPGRPAVQQQLQRADRDLLRPDLQKHHPDGHGSAREDEEGVLRGKERLPEPRPGRPVPLRESGDGAVQVLSAESGHPQHAQSVLQVNQSDQAGDQLPNRVQAAHHRVGRHRARELLRAHQQQHQVHLLHAELSRRHQRHDRRAPRVPAENLPE
jgi:hypothetical protein